MRDSLINTCGMKMRKLLDKKSEVIAQKYGVRNVELEILLFLYHSPCGDTAKDIVEEKNLSKAHISKSVDNLRAKGFVVLTEDEIEKNPNFMAYFVDHTAGVYPTAASGAPWNAASIAVTGDTIGDLNEDLAAEQKARVTYDNILRLVDDPDIIEPIKFLREREIVHYQRFGEGLRLVTDKLDSKNYYACTPSFDK